MSASPIAVVGLASLLPGSDDLDGFWRSLLEARDCFSDVPEAHWRIEDYFDPTPRAKDKTYGKRGGFIPAQPFDALAFGLPPAALPSTDVAQLLALLIAQRCLDDADAGQPDRFDRNRCSVILGAAATTQLVAHMSGRMAQPMWREGLRRAGLDEPTVQRAMEAISEQFVPWQESTFPGLLGNVIAGRIANRFDLGGTNCALDAACASSLAALSMAIGELRSGQADTVLTGGVDALNDILMFLCFSQTPALSLSGDCRPFSDAADGTMLGEGVAMLALRRLEDAERDGHRIYGIIRGIGSSSDGRAKSVYAPRPAGQAKALRRAYENAGYGPETVELLEAHGTGTIAGDAAEFAALHEVFGEANPERAGWCALGSVKSQIGHTKAAAGAASLVKAVLALHQRTLPPTIKVERPNPALDLSTTPFYLNTTLRPWFLRRETPRRASVSSFGFGGSNFHVTLEEYLGEHRAGHLDGSPLHLLLLSGSEPESLRTTLERWREELPTPQQLGALSRKSQASFDASEPIRLALLVATPADLELAVAEGMALLAGTGSEGRSERALMRRGAPVSPEGVAFLFPGQGSQYLGMGRDLALQFPDAFAVWQTAVEEVRDGPIDLGEVVFPAGVFDAEAREALEARLRATDWAQPGLAAASLAQLALLGRAGLRPAASAGHSFGELVALHAAGSYDERALLRLARARGEAMAACGEGGEGSEVGSMLAVAGDAATVRGLLERFGDGQVVLANDNHPRQAVLSGPLTSLEALRPALTEAGLGHQLLRVSAAFHSPLVAPAAAEFALGVAAVDFAAPSYPVVANATALPYGEEVDEIRQQLAEQLSRPVRFRESVETLHGELGCRVFVEVGAGSVLTGLVGKCLAGREYTAVALDRSGVHGVESWWRGMAELATLGLPLRLEALHDDLSPALEELPSRPKGPAVVQVGGAHLGKPYPPKGGVTPPNPPSPSVELRRGEIVWPAESLESISPVGIVAEPTASAPAPHVMHESVEAMQPAGSEPWYYGEEGIEMAESGRDHGAPPYYAAGGDAASRILEAQRLTQQALLESYSLTLRGLGGGSGVAPGMLAPVVHALPAPVAPQENGSAPAPLPPPPAPPSNRVAAVQEVAPAPRPAAPVAQPAHVASAASAPTVAPVAAAPAPPPPAPVATGADLPAMVLAIIAEKTGYPVEALGVDMELEADLGIDSIKRVEILAAVGESIPGVDPSQADPASIRKVGDLLGILGAVASPAAPASPAASPAQPVPSSSAPSAPAVASAGAGEAAATGDIVLAVIAEKTGYPVEALAAEMELEADLGIDSIKRVEILAALGERLPGLDPSAADPAKIRRVGDLLSLLGEGPPEGPKVAAAPHVGGTGAAAEVVEVVERREVLWMSRRPPHRPHPALGGCRTLCVSGAPEGTDVALRGALMKALELRGLALGEAGEEEADLVVLAHGLSEGSLEPAFELLTRMATRSGGKPRLLLALIAEGVEGSAGVAGLVKTAALEWEVPWSCQTHLIPSLPLAELGVRVAEELLEGAGEAEVRLGESPRREVRVRPAARVGQVRRPLPEGSWIISGGARGVTAACARALVEAGARKLALLGRSALREEPESCLGVDGEAGLKRVLIGASEGKPDLPGIQRQVREILAQREVRATIASLEASGAQVRYASVDVTDPKGVRAFVQELRELWGPVRGLVHGAGVLADRRLGEKTLAQFRSVMEPKLGGGRALLEACADEPLEMLCFFSSVAAQSGNLGQSDYAAANAVLDSWAHEEAARRGEACQVVSIAWGPWDGGMVTESLAKHFTARGVGLIPQREGAQAMVAELTSGTVANVILGCGLGAESVGEGEALTFDLQADPYLTDHRIRDTAVLPMTMALDELLALGRRSFGPSAELRELTLRQGLLLREGTGDLLLSGAPHASGAGVLGSLRHPEGKVAYEAHLLPGASPRPAPVPVPVATPLDHAALREPYAEALFHGPAFQVIREILSSTPEGIVARIATAGDMGWPGGWQLDPAALDGALQLLRVWRFAEDGKVTLPTSIAGCRSWGRWPESGEVLCTLRCVREGELRIRGDALFSSLENGEVYAALDGMVMHLHTQA